MSDSELQVSCLNRFEYMQSVPPETPKKPAELNENSSPRLSTRDCFEELIRTSVLVDDINPSVLHNFTTFDTCGFEDMLLYLLRRCLVTETDTISIEECLLKVLPTCNNNAVRTSLVDYCRAESEPERYGPFVLACNNALQALKNVSSLPLRPETDNILFHRSDPSVIEGTQKGLKSQRKPDIVIVSLDTAAHANGQDPYVVWDDYTLIEACNRPKAFEWANILSCQEFKVKSKKGPLALPPINYTIEDLEPVDPQPPPFNSVGELIHDQDTETQSLLSPKITSAGDGPPALAPSPRRSPRISTSGSGSGFPTTQGSGPGHTTKKGSGSGYATKKGSGSGYATKKGSGSGYATKKGSGSGRDPKKSSGLGHAPKKASGSGSAAKNVLDSAEKGSDSGPAASGSGLTLTPGPEKSHLKRSSDNKQAASSKKAKASPRGIPAMIQSALYPAERLSSDCSISHVINLTIIDEVAFVWWYDKHGGIQSQGINFVKNLPHFLVLLLAFQRFSLRDWGVIPEFYRQEKLFRFKFPEGIEVVIKASEKFYGDYGRCTQMLKVQSHSLHPKYGEFTKLDMVMKVSWPEISRRSEPEIIQEAVSRAGTDKDVIEHLPDLIYSHDLGDYSTVNVREALHLSVTGARTCRVMLFRKLYPITDLFGTSFWIAYWHCIRCHYKLWELGIKHRDISEHNLMYERRGNSIHGTLIDYDLARLRNTNGPQDARGTERTGTMPFMALDLLTKDGWAGKVEHVYRHDNESFIWVLLWIICHYHNGQVISHPPFYEWLERDHISCLNYKSAITNLIPVPVTPSYAMYKKPAEKLLLVLQERAFNKSRYKEHISPLATRNVLLGKDQDMDLTAQSRDRPTDEHKMEVDDAEAGAWRDEIFETTLISESDMKEPLMSVVMEEFAAAVFRAQVSIYVAAWWRKTEG